MSSRFTSENTKVMGNTYNFSVVSSVSDTWSFSIREEHRVRMFEVTVLRKIFGPKMEEVKKMDKTVS